MKIILASLALALTVWAAGAQEHTSMDNQTADGYRGIWFTYRKPIRRLPCMPSGYNVCSVW